jgi:hypothetical protein
MLRASRNSLEDTKIGWGIISGAYLLHVLFLDVGLLLHLTSVVDSLGDFDLAVVL